MHSAAQSKASTDTSLSLCLAQVLGSSQQSKEEQVLPGGARAKAGDLAHSLDLLICMDLEEVLLNTEQVSWLAEAS